VAVLFALLGNLMPCLVFRPSLELPDIPQIYIYSYIVILARANGKWKILKSCRNFSTGGRGSLCIIQL